MKVCLFSANFRTKFNVIKVEVRLHAQYSHNFEKKLHLVACGCFASQFYYYYYFFVILVLIATFQHSYLPYEVLTYAEIPALVAI